MVALDPDHTKWRQQIIDTHLFKQVNDKSRVLFSLDLKNQCIYLPKDYVCTKECLQG